MSLEFEPGKLLLGKYRVERAVGKGGFGAVYLATDLRLRRSVAIKTLSYTETGLDNRFGTGTYVEFVTRFRREAEVSSYFTSNPNIITVYSLEEDDEANYYLIMEYLENGSLASLLKKQGHLPLSKICEISLDICHALSDIHNHPADIVHRDIKPSNILLRTSGEAVLADFGVAQVGSDSHRTMLVGEKGPRHPGSPPYKSPEQTNNFEYLTPASDLYSLGLVMYEMATGKVFAKFRRLPPSRENDQIPGWLDEIVAKLLQQKIEDRYQQAEEVTEDLKKGLNRSGTQLEEHTTPVSWVQVKSLPASPSADDRPADYDTEIARRERELEEAFRNRAEPSPIEQLLRETEEARQRQFQAETEEKARQEREAEEARQKQAVVTGQINNFLEQLNQAEVASNWNLAIELGNSILQLQAGHPAGLAKTAAAHAAKGMLAFNQGKYEQAATEAGQAIELAPEQPGYYFGRGSALYKLGQYEKAVEDYTQAIKLDPTQASYYYGRGLSFYKSGDFHRSIDDFNRAIERDPRQAEFYYSRGLTLDWRGSHFFNKSDQKQALADFDRAIQLDPNQAQYFFQRGLTYRKTEDNQMALFDFDRAIQIDPNQASYYFSRGMCYAILKEYDRALLDFDGAIARDAHQANYYYWRGVTHKVKKNKRAARHDLELAVYLGHPDARKELTNL